MIPVPSSDEDADRLHSSYKGVTVFLDGLRPVNGTDFFDANGDIALPLGDARWSGNGTKPDEGKKRETGLYFYWRRVDDTWADSVYDGLFRRCLCV